MRSKYVQEVPSAYDLDCNSSPKILSWLVMHCVEISDPGVLNIADHEYEVEKCPTRHVAYELGCNSSLEIFWWLVKDSSKINWQRIVNIADDEYKTENYPRRTWCPISGYLSHLRQIFQNLWWIASKCVTQGFLTWNIRLKNVQDLPGTYWDGRFVWIKIGILHRK